MPTAPTEKHPPENLVKPLMVIFLSLVDIGKAIIERREIKKRISKGNLKEIAREREERTERRNT
jgi:hypothetical protein